VTFAPITLCIASQLVFISLSTQFGNFWIHPRMGGGGGMKRFFIGRWIVKLRGEQHGLRIVSSGLSY
jgi:hypothetical protein